MRLGEKLLQAVKQVKERQSLQQGDTVRVRVETASPDDWIFPPQPQTKTHTYFLYYNAPLTAEYPVWKGFARATVAEDLSQRHNIRNAVCQRLRIGRVKVQFEDNAPYSPGETKQVALKNIEPLNLV